MQKTTCAYAASRDSGSNLVDQKWTTGRVNGVKSYIRVCEPFIAPAALTRVYKRLAIK